tara:strand:- start:1151 stop:3220 length:2070 start_codon:yes stop_codon:yes gene_type:complete
MKDKIYLLIASLFLVVFSFSDVYSQKNRKMKKADQAFELELYSEAIELYKKAYKKTKDKNLKAENIFKQAECYRLSGKILQASIYYERAVFMNYHDAIAIFNYAEVLRMLGKYEKARDQYVDYIQKTLAEEKMSKEEIMKLASDDARHINFIKGELGLRSCEFALKWKDLPTRYRVKSMPLLNSRYNDFSPTYGDADYSKLYFVSSREGDLSSKIDGRTGEYFSDIWFTTFNKERNMWSKPTLEIPPINTTGNEGPIHLNNRGTIMYITQCKFEKKKILGCGIYVSERSGRDWKESKLLQLKVDSNTVGHPTLNKDETIIIFSADLPNGYGGKDLWISRRGKRNTWSEPQNLGHLVNTAGDELFPFILEDDEGKITIYFASNGHIGMGGLDIYKTTENNIGAFSSPVNLKSPINSSGDDFAMIVERGQERGYLTSNREGGFGGDDIYQFELVALNLSIQGILTDAKTGSIMTDVIVKLVGSNGTTASVKTDNTGKYSFPLDPLTSYEVIVNTEGYIAQNVKETTEGIETDKILIVDIAVDPQKKEVILPIVNFDFNKYELDEESILALNNLAEGLMDNTNFIVQITGHTDDIGSQYQNKKLSQKRADVCFDYLVSIGVNPGQLITKAMGKKEPFVIEVEDGRFKVGDVLTESYIRKIKFKKNKQKANSYNRRAAFRVISKEYNTVVEDN